MSTGGPPNYGNPSGDNQSMANSSGFGGSTMGGPAYGAQRPQFGQQPGTPQSGYGQAYGGIQQQQQQPVYQQSPSGPGYGGTPYNGSNDGGQPPSNPPYPQTPQRQQPQGGGGGYTPGSGSITRFADSPQMQQQHGGSSMFSQSSPYNFQPPPQPGSSNTGGMSFAQRGAMLQQQTPHYGQPQQQQQSNQQTSPAQGTPSSASTAGMSFAQRSAMMRQNQPPASNVYGGAQRQQQQPQMQYTPQPSSNYQYQQQQQQSQYQPTPGGYGQGGLAPSQGSMHGGMPSQQQPQQQQTSMAGSQTVGSFSQRSAMMGQSQQMGSSYMQPPQPQGTPGGMQGSAMQPPQQQPQMGMQNSNMQPQQQSYNNMGMPIQQPGMQPPMPQQPPPKPSIYEDPPEVIAQQNRLLTDATRKVQEHAYYMKQAMERHDLPTVLDRASQMVGELGEHAHSHHHHHVHPPAPGATGSTTALSPKNYYELHLRALEELPTLEDYLLGVAQGNHAPPSPGMMTPGPNMYQQQQPPQMAEEKISYTMKELYDCVQYCPNVLSRLYLQICAASALIRSGEVGARWVLKDMIQAVKCVQNPVRGLFLRHYLLQAFRDKLPNESIPPTDVVPYGTATPVSSDNDGTPAPSIVADVNSTEKGTVKDSYEFVLANFVEMNKLWVRIQHLPGDGRSKEIRRRREKDRNELRILVGTNLVRLSALDSVTSQIYGQVILPTVLDHIIISGDPLAQAYLIDCIVQVFPDEYHIETMPILLAACPKLRDKVNIRTILNALMERLANYLADEELLDEKDSNQVKRQMAQDSFKMMDECVQSVYNARGPKLQAREVIRLQTALLSFSMKCYRGNLEQITLCLDNCVVGLQQARANQALMQESRMPMMDPNSPRVLPQLDEVATMELEKLLSIPLDELALGVLKLDHYADLIGFLPWANRRQLALTMLDSVSKAGTSPESVKEIDELFSVVAPVLRDENSPPPGQQATPNASMERTTNLMAGLGVSTQQSFGATNSGVQEPEDPQFRNDAGLVSKLIHLLYHENTDIQFEMLGVARQHLGGGKIQRTVAAYEALVFASLKLAKRVFQEEIGEAIDGKEKEESEHAKEKQEEESGEAEDGNQDVGDSLTPEDESTAKDEELPSGAEEASKGEESKTSAPGSEEQNQVEAEPSPTATSSEGVADSTEIGAAKTITCRKIFIFVQETIATMAKGRPETAVKLYLESALLVERLAWKKNQKKATGQDAFGSITYEFISQSFSLYEAHSGDSRLQYRCIISMIRTLLASRSLSKEDYEGLIMKTAQYSAKMLKKPEQCVMVAQCAHLFYKVGTDGEALYSNPQRSLECLQRSLKLADSCTNTNPANVQLFVDLLEDYLFFFEKKHPSVSGNYITGLVALIKEHTENLGKFGGSDSSPVGDAKAHFLRVVKHIKEMKDKEEFSERFAAVDVSAVIA
mmetsp:Transcript_118293/g.341957  ORF Transcript_118293/g.341957 Transcript_118293/m.341957 type:complete len:1440 (+) Transcript_118293:219-4538(+)